MEEYNENTRYFPLKLIFIYFLQMFYGSKEYFKKKKWNPIDLFISINFVDFNFILLVYFCFPLLYPYFLLIFFIVFYLLLLLLSLVLLYYFIKFYISFKFFFCFFRIVYNHMVNK